MGFRFSVTEYMYFAFQVLRDLLKIDDVNFIEQVMKSISQTKLPFDKKANKN